MRVLVCGGRGFTNCGLVWATLDQLARTDSIDCIIEGDAPGADRIAGAWAKRRRIDLRLFPADWKQHGRAAAPIRNQKMLDEGKPDFVIAFPGGKGTADMVHRAKKAGIPIASIS
mgnify:FL=1